MSSSVNFNKPTNQTQETSYWKTAVRYAAYGTAIAGTVCGVVAIAMASGAFSNVDSTPTPPSKLPVFGPQPAPLPTCPSFSSLASITNSEAHDDICNDNSPLHMICEGNMGIFRKEMPQLAQEIVPAFLGNMTARGIEVTYEVIDPALLTPVQQDMSAKSIAGMMQAAAAGKWDPCKAPILSAEGFVLDGHHRYAACGLLDRMMNIINIHDTAANVLKYLSEFDGVYHLGLGQANSK